MTVWFIGASPWSKVNGEAYCYFLFFLIYEAEDLMAGYTTEAATQMIQLLPQFPLVKLYMR